MSLLDESLAISSELGMRPLMERVLSRTKQQLQSILNSLQPEEWEKPYIFSYDEESRIVHTLVATKPGTNELYYYEPDDDKWEPLNLP